MEHPLADRIRALNRRGSTYRNHGVKVVRENTDVMADRLAESSEKLTEREARIMLIQHIRRPEFKGKHNAPTRQLLTELAYGDMLDADKVAQLLVNAEGSCSWAAPAADRALIARVPATENERAAMKAAFNFQMQVDELKRWLTGEDVDVAARIAAEEAAKPPPPMSTEMAVVARLLKANQGNLVTRAEAEDAVGTGDDAYYDVCLAVTRLRKFGLRIKTVRGSGYILA